MSNTELIKYKCDEKVMTPHGIKTIHSISQMNTHIAYYDTFYMHEDITSKRSMYFKRTYMRSELSPIEN